jgi:hypothetical protein
MCTKHHLTGQICLLGQEKKMENEKHDASRTGSRSVTNLPPTISPYKFFISLQNIIFSIVYRLG